MFECAISLRDSHDIKIAVHINVYFGHSGFISWWLGEDVIICGWSLDISDNNTVSNMEDNTAHTDKIIEVIN